jgi:hypothetical protein
VCDLIALQGNYWEAIKGSTNEIQAGGGVLFCMNYADSHDIDGMKGKFNHALKMQIQIISTAGWDELVHTHTQTLLQLACDAWICGPVVERLPVVILTIGSTSCQYY